MTPNLSHPSELETTILHLQGMTRLDVMSQWHHCQAELALTDALNPNQWLQWPIASLNDRHHVAWDKGEYHLWLGQTITVPESLDQYPIAGLELRIDLTWWSILSEIYVNGQLAQEGDLYDCFSRVVLSEMAQPGETIDVAIHLISPGHDPGALVKAMLWFEPKDVQQMDPGMIADEMEVLQGYLKQFRPEALETLDAIAKSINWDVRGNPEAFHQELEKVRSQLRQWGDWLQTRQIYWTGHAHLDMAWLWPVSETWEVAERTFASAINLMNEFPEMKFCHSSPALYDWIERNRPEQFTQIQQKIQNGQWEVAAGLWVEPEFNLVSGESIVRQVLYGQRYTQEKFGVLSVTAWLPDSFGFCWQLPQILKQGGIEYFVTQKLRWNDSTEFPHEVFQWRSPDGTEIYSIMLPPIGTRIDPVKMSDFAQKWETHTGNDLSYWLPGIGDHGGGPTKDMLEVARRWDSSPIIPKLKSTTAEDFCRQTEAKLPSPPVWNDELYLEYHRGCYTSHADQKLYNRQCETVLMEAELWSAIATLISDSPYPKLELELAWKKVLFNQFHDILPGSAIPQVFVDANQDWEFSLQTGLELRKKALDAIALQVQHTVPNDCHAFLAFNSLNWTRSTWFSVEIPNNFRNRPFKVQTTDNPSVEYLITSDSTLYIYAEDLPSVGYRIYWLAPLDIDTSPLVSQTLPVKAGQASVETWQLENEHLRVSIDPQTGEVSSLFHKQENRETLSAPGNQLQFFRDQGQYWDAWNIDPDYATHQLPGATLTQIEWCDRTEQRIRTTLTFENSTFTQEYILRPHTPYLIVETQVDWNTDHVLVKTSFPLTLQTETVTCDMPCGVIERPTLPNPQPLEDWQKAKWEIPAIHWADLTDESGQYGVSILNDCKYGYDAQPSQLRLTLLRGAVWPDPDCDRGHHHFSYAIYPHAGNWNTAKTTALGYEFNRPVQTQPLSSNSKGDLSSHHSFLSIPDYMVLMAFKQSEESRDRWVLRYYESNGHSHDNTQLLNHLDLSITAQLDGLEQRITPVSQTAPISDIPLKAWEIQSLELAERIA